MEFTLLAAALTGVAAMWSMLRLTGDHDEFDRLIGAGVVGLFVGRLAAMVTAGVNPITNPLDILIVRGGVDTGWAALGAIAALAWSAKGDWQVLDLVTPAAILGIAGWHLGCLWRGTCLGAAGEVPWGWALEASDVTRHPVELYAALLMIIAAIALHRARFAPGVRAGLGLAVVAGARLLTQPLRPSLGLGPVWWYAAGLVLAVVFVLTHRRPRLPA